MQLPTPSHLPPPTFPHKLCRAPPPLFVFQSSIFRFPMSSFFLLPSSLPFRLRALPDRTTRALPPNKLLSPLDRKPTHTPDIVRIRRRRAMNPVPTARAAPPDNAEPWGAPSVAPLYIAP